jgi:YVTN family beta-propeller protein
LTKTLIGTAAMGVFLSFAAGADQSAPHGTLLALSKKNHTLSVVDPVTLKVVAQIPVGPDPHEVIASSDGKTAYVSNMGSGGESFHELDVIDLVAKKALPSIDTGPLLGPHGLAYAGGSVWFTAQGAMAVARFDPAAGKVDWIMGTGQDRTHMIYVAPEQKQIYATNVEAGTVSIFEYVLLPPPHGPNGKAFPGAKPRWDWVHTVVSTAKGDEGFDVLPDGRELWTTSGRDGTVSVIDLASKKVTATLDAKAAGANRLKFTPDGKRALISSLRTGDLLVYDVGSRKELKRLNLGHGGAGIQIDPAGERAYVGCTADDYVAVVDLAKLEVIGHIDVGGKPDGLAWAGPVSSSSR